MKIKKWIMVLVLAFAMTFAMAGTVMATSGTDSSTEEKKAPVYDITINIVPEKGWLVSNSTVDIKVIDNKNTGTFQIKKVEAKIGADGTYQDITDTMSIEVSEKSSVYVTVTDSYGTTYTQTRYIDGYDTTAPTFNVAVNNGVMVIETNDNESGVAAIYINGYKYKPNKKGKLTVRLQKFDASYANFSIYVVDNSGNQSEPYIIDNPYYKASTDEEDTSNPADSLPTSGEATDTGESSAQVVSVTDEKGNDISDKVNTKQFYSIVTKDGQQFYLVIDMSDSMGSNEYFEGSADTPAYYPSNGTVYFLTYVSNNDLLNITSSDEVTLGYNSVAGGNNIDEEATSHNPEEETETTEESTEEKAEESGSGNNPMAIIIVLVVVGCIVFATMKSKSSGKNKTPMESGDESEEDESEEEYEYFDAENYEEEGNEEKEDGEEKSDE